MKVISSGATGHLCGALTLMTILPPWNFAKRVAHLARAVEVVVPMAAFAHAGMLSGRMREPVAMIEVVVVRLAGLGGHHLLVDIDLLGGIDDVRHPPVEDLALVTKEF